ncbi:MAG: 3-dehydroquinate synthase [Candidatus Rokubacteria bacterium GWC2_70_16]|nr:MAG: 3-dehydroquinate synthase [Candidatus Rokubacteria bacterium GWC2_70_16]OGL20744.1 MAG: 3-dehydroquinate synthase [Candidatus Rokubacteria bacterium RIFCSPLOWO2_12_FULL_71_19]
MINIPVSLGARSYRILVGPGLLAGVGAELSRIGVGSRVAVLSDEPVLALHGRPVVEGLEAAGFAVTTMRLPEGEAAKTLATAEQAWDALLAAGLDRTSTVVAVGGGAVGDLAGFVAATYMRGVSFVQVPTTLLAQVDASIGGKTAIDHPRAKNLIGAFHQPRLVAVDPAVLLTLPEREFRSGLAEVIKHGIVLDAPYFADLEASLPALLARDLPTLTRIVAGSCRIKASVVERDEHETELRAVLNYGHTIGHALEAVTGFERWTHGEAVALGIAAAARLAERLGIGGSDATARQTRLLQAAGLPVRGSGAAPAAVVEALARDKKARDGRVPFVLAPRIGAFQLVFDVPQEAVLATLDELA